MLLKGRKNALLCLPEDEPLRRKAEMAVQLYKDFNFRVADGFEAEARKTLNMVQQWQAATGYSLEELGIEPWVVKARQQAQKVLALVTVRVDHESAKVKGELAAARKATDEDMEEYDHYVLSGGSSFVWVKDAGVLSAGKCWIQLEKSPANARALSIVFEGETTGISTVKTAADKMDGEWYDLSGRRVAQPATGIYVKNGKKVIVK